MTSPVPFVALARSAMDMGFTAASSAPSPRVNSAEIATSTFCQQSWFPSPLPTTALIKT